MAKRSAAKTRKKAPAKASAIKLTTIKSPFTKSDTLNYLAQRAGLKRAQVGLVVMGLQEVIESHLKKNGPGMYTLQGVAKFKVVRKPATKARKGINPFTGEETTFKAKPARNVVKIRPLKKLKDSV
jgi:nucleoid DNA-binding protein